MPTVRMMWHTVWTPNCLKHHPSGQRELFFLTFFCVEKLRTIPTCICPDVLVARPDTIQCSTSYGIPSKTQLWEDRCNRPDDVDSRPNALIYKASIAFKIQTSERQSSWFGRASIRYGNFVHQINRPDAWSLGMEITCNGSTTVRSTGHHLSDAAQIRKEFQQNFWKAYRTVVRPNGLWLPSRRRLGFIKLDAHLNPQPINRGLYAWE
jgi:hypothetical protein